MQTGEWFICFNKIYLDNMTGIECKKTAHEDVARVVAHEMRHIWQAERYTRHFWNSCRFSWAGASAHDWSIKMIQFIEKVMCPTRLISWVIGLVLLPFLLVVKAIGNVGSAIYRLSWVECDARSYSQSNWEDWLDYIDCDETS